MKKYYDATGWSRPAHERQLIANWYSFVGEKRSSDEIEQAINLTRILAGPQYGDEDTRALAWPSYKAKHKPVVHMADLGATAEDIQNILDDMPPSAWDDLDDDGSIYTPDADPDDLPF